MALFSKKTFLIPAPLFEYFNYYANFPRLAMKGMIFGTLTNTAACCTGISGHKAHLSTTSPAV